MITEEEGPQLETHKMVNTRSHLDVVHQIWKLLKQRTKEGSYELDGDHLHIAEVIATAQ